MWRGHGRCAVGHAVNAKRLGQGSGFGAGSGGFALNVRTFGTGVSCSLTIWKKHNNTVFMACWHGRLGAEMTPERVAPVRTLTISTGCDCINQFVQKVLKATTHGAHLATEAGGGSNLK